MISIKNLNTLKSLCDSASVQAYIHDVLPKDLKTGSRNLSNYELLKHKILKLSVVFQNNEHHVKAYDKDTRKSVKIVNLEKLIFVSIDNTSPIMWINTNNSGFVLNKETGEVSKSISSSQKTRIHVILAIDKSGSMYSKWDIVKEGVRDKVNQLIENSQRYEDQEYTYTLVWFDHRTTISERKLAENLHNLNLNTSTGGGTALNDTIIKCINLGLDSLKDSDHLLIELFTDGEDEHSRSSELDVARTIAKTDELENVTIAISGTGRKFNKYAKSIGILKSNTLHYENNREGTKRQGNMSVNSIVNYAINLSRGISVKDSFYVDKL